MNEKIISCFDTFQVADLDDDMIGMYKSLVDWIREIRSQVPLDTVFPAIEDPHNFYKLQPHQPKMELRKNVRKMLAHTVKKQEETDEVVKLLNTYVAIFATAYMYHMPVKELISYGTESTEFTREMSKTALLNDGMSENWIKEPSGKDFTKIML